MARPKCKVIFEGEASVLSGAVGILIGKEKECLSVFLEPPCGTLTAKLPVRNHKVAKGC
jgi:hypothetical protein